MQFQLFFDYDAMFQSERTIPTLSRTLFGKVRDKVRVKV